MDCPDDRRGRGRRRRTATALALGAVVASTAALAAPALAATYNAPLTVSVAPEVLADVDGVAVNPSGTAYVLEGGTSSSRIIAVPPSGSPFVITLTGVVDAQGIAVGAGSTLYVADTGNHRVVSLSAPTGAGSPALAVVAGTGTAGAPLETTATSSPLRAPRGVAWDAANSTLYIADTGNNQVEKVVGGNLSIVAGTGLVGGPATGSARSALLSGSEDVAVGPAGELYIADTGNGAVVKVVSGTASVVATGITGVDALTVANGDVIAAGTTSVTAITASGTAPLGSGYTDVEGLGAATSGAVWIADDAAAPALWTAAPTTPAPAAVRITSAAPTTAVKGVALTRTFTASGSPAPTWSFVGTPPACLGTAAIGASTGVLTATPGTAGPCSFVVRADNTSTHDEQAVTLTVGSVPVAPAVKPDVVAGQGSATLTWKAPTASTVAGEAVTGYVITPYVGTTAGTTRTVAAGVLAAAVTGLKSGTAYTFTVAATNAFGTGPASAASAAVTPYGGVTEPPAGLTRVEGRSRITTATKVSQQLFPDAGSARAVVLASSTSFADSLAGARLASAVGGPLLLVDPKALNGDVASELARVLAVPSATTASTAVATPFAAADSSAPKPTALGTVYLLGGTGALSADVETAVKAVNAKYTAVRISGADRYETAVKIAAQTTVDDPVAGAPIYVASGRDYPDGLAVAALAARTGGVLLLTDGATMPASTLQHLQTFDPNSELLVAVGGPAAKATTGHGGERAVVGADRYATARLVAERFTGGDDRSAVRTVGLATGQNWPDALAGAAAMGNLHGPLLLTPSSSLSPQVGPALSAVARSDAPRSALVFGGPAVVSGGTADAFRALVSS